MPERDAASVDLDDYRESIDRVRESARSDESGDDDTSDTGSDRSSSSGRSRTRRESGGSGADRSAESDAGAVDLEDYQDSIDRVESSTDDDDSEESRAGTEDSGRQELGASDVAATDLEDYQDSIERVRSSTDEDGSDDREVLGARDAASTDLEDYQESIDRVTPRSRYAAGGERSQPPDPTEHLDADVRRGLREDIAAESPLDPDDFRIYDAWSTGNVGTETPAHVQNRFSVEERERIREEVAASSPIFDADDIIITDYETDDGEISFEYETSDVEFGVWTDWYAQADAVAEEVSDDVEGIGPGDVIVTGGRDGEEWEIEIEETARRNVLLDDVVESSDQVGAGGPFTRDDLVVEVGDDGRMTANLSPDAVASNVAEDLGISADEVMVRERSQPREVDFMAAGTPTGGMGFDIELSEAARTELAREDAAAEWGVDPDEVRVTDIDGDEVQVERVRRPETEVAEDAGRTATVLASVWEGTRRGREAFAEGFSVTPGARSTEFIADRIFDDESSRADQAREALEPGTEWWDENVTGTFTAGESDVIDPERYGGVRPFGISGEDVRAMGETTAQWTNPARNAQDVITLGELGRDTSEFLDEQGAEGWQTGIDVASQAPSATVAAAQWARGNPRDAGVGLGAMLATAGAGGAAVATGRAGVRAGSRVGDPVTFRQFAGDTRAQQQITIQRQRQRTDADGERSTSSWVDERTRTPEDDLRAVDRESQPRVDTPDEDLRAIRDAEFDPGPGFETASADLRTQPGRTRVRGREGTTVERTIAETDQLLDDVSRQLDSRPFSVGEDAAAASATGVEPGTATLYGIAGATSRTGADTLGVEPGQEAGTLSGAVDVDQQSLTQTETALGAQMDADAAAATATMSQLDTDAMLMQDQQLATQQDTATIAATDQMAATTTGQAVQSRQATQSAQATQATQRAQMGQRGMMSPGFDGFGGFGLTSGRGTLTRPVRPARPRTPARTSRRWRPRPRPQPIWSEGSGMSETDSGQFDVDIENPIATAADVLGVGGGPGMTAGTASTDSFWDESTTDSWDPVGAFEDEAWEAPEFQTPGWDGTEWEYEMDVAAWDESDWDSGSGDIDQWDDGGDRRNNGGLFGGLI